MEKHAVARLIGASPGYVGYEEGGYLTETVCRRPYSVILLDEVEKAHPEVFNILLQVLDDGRMTDGHDRIVDFRNTVILGNVGFDPVYGARPLKRAIQQKLENGLAQRILAGEFGPGDTVRVDATDGELVFGG